MGTQSKANKLRRVVLSVAVNNIAVATDPIRSICRCSVISSAPALRSLSFTGWLTGHYEIFMNDLG